MGKMIKIEKFSKKGIAFTLSTYFLIMTVIAILPLLSIKPLFQEKLALEKLHDLSNSVEESIKDILSSYYNLNIRIEQVNDNETLNVSFKETLSRNEDDWGEQFSNQITNLKTFVEAHDSEVKINITTFEDKEIPLTIYPYGINYSRSWGIGHVILSVDSPNFNFSGYELIIDTGGVQIDKINSNLRKAGNFLFKVNAIDNFGGNFLAQKSIDPYDNHQATVFLVGGNKIDITFSNGALEIWTNAASTITVTTKIVGLPPKEEKAQVKMFENAVNVTLSQLNVERIVSIKTSN